MPTRKSSNPFDLMADHLAETIKKTEEEVKQQKANTSQLESQLRRMRKAQKSFGTPNDQAQMKPSVTLDHVSKAVASVFKRYDDRLTMDELTKHVVSELEQLPLSRHGLKLRVLQGLRRLQTDSEGFVLAPQKSTSAKQDTPAA